MSLAVDKGHESPLAATCIAYSNGTVACAVDADFKSRDIIARRAAG